jgi:drug/metabolite transporter (DMT)-like permease
MDPIYIFYSVIVSFLWGIAAIIHKIFLKNISDITFMCMSGIFYFLILIFYIAYHNKIIQSDLKKMDANTYLWIFLAVFFGLFISNALYFYVLKYNEPSIVVAITFSCPLFTLLGAYFILNERIHTYGLLGVLSIVLGIVLVSLNKE